MAQSLRELVQDKKTESDGILKTFHSICFMTGVNVKYKSHFKDPIKLINVALVVTSLIGLCAQYVLLWHNRHESFVHQADPICTATQVWLSIFKLTYMLFVQDEFYELLRTATHGLILRDLEIFDLDIAGHYKHQLLSKVQQVLDSSWLHIKYQLNFFTFACTMVCGLYMFSCIFINYYYLHIQPQNFTLQLPMPALFPMWHDYGMQWPYYHIQYFITGAENYICGMSAVCFDGIFIVIVVHCSALLEILHRLIGHSTDEAIPQSERIKYLLCCVKLHQRIYIYFAKINEMYCNPSLAQCFLSTLILCIVMFMANIGLEEDITLFCKMSSFLLAASFQIAIYCYNGQKIITQSELTPSFWYNTRWYNESPHFRYITKMMIMRTNRAMALEVSGFTTMSLVTFMSIMQTSGSYFLLLKNLSVED